MMANRKISNKVNRNLLYWIIGIVIAVIVLGIIINNSIDNHIFAPGGKYVQENTDTPTSGSEVTEKPERGCEETGCSSCAESCLDGNNDGKKECIENGLLECLNNNCVINTGGPDKVICTCGEYNICEERCVPDGRGGWMIERITNPAKHLCYTGQCVTKGPDSDPAANCKNTNCARDCGGCMKCNEVLGECENRNDVEHCGDGVCVPLSPIQGDSNCPQNELSPSCKTLDCNVCTQKCREINGEAVCVDGQGVICDIGGVARCYQPPLDCSSLELTFKEEFNSQ